MKYIRTLFTVIWKIWFYLLALFCTLTLGALVYILTYQKNDKLTYSLMRLWAHIIFYGCGFTYTFKYKEKLDPKQAYIFISNHTSMGDILLMFILHPNKPLVFVGKKEVENYPIFGRIYKKVSILVDRSDRSSREAVFPTAKRILEKENKIVVFFPEGGVPDRDVILAEFKDGAFLLSGFCNIPLVVYSFHNLKNYFPFVFTLGYPSRVYVERLGILYPDKYKDFTEIKKTAFNMIYEEIKNDKIEHPGIK